MGGKEEEDELSNRLLVVIGMLALTSVLNKLLDIYPRFKLSQYFQGEQGIGMIIGILVGLIAQNSFGNSDIKDFFFEQALFFRLFLLPAVVYEQ